MIKIKIHSYIEIAGKNTKVIAEISFWFLLLMGILLCITLCEHVHLVYGKGFAYLLLFCHLQLWAFSFL